MRIVFLDLDGVLNSQAWYDRRGPHPPDLDYFDYAIDPETVEHLNRLCAATGARIVFSSTWRGDLSVRRIAADFLRVGCTARVIGKTPRLHGETRGTEIAAWLTIYRAGLETDFVILDDDGDMGLLLPRLIQTDRATGLTDADVDRAIAVLTTGR